MSDLISRQAAMDALKDVSEHYTDKGREWHPHVNFMVEAIQDLPSAQLERKKGQWLNIDESEKWECSVCGRMMWFSPRLGVKPSDYNFCPNCGADMRGEQDG